MSSAEDTLRAACWTRQFEAVSSTVEPERIDDEPDGSVALSLVGAAITACNGDAHGRDGRSCPCYSCGGGAESTDAPASGRWEPTPTTTAWQWQLQGKIDTSVPAAVYDVDGFEVSKRTVRRLHRMGRKVICYLDVGSWEPYRPDAKRFPKTIIGRRYKGFPDERWLDIRRFRLFAKPLERGFDLCARKGFDAVEPDNLAGWENNTGFPIARQDQLRFNFWVARQVHTRGMAVALKNDGGQAEELVDGFDFAIVEQCFQYEECGPYRTFVEHGKGVFEAEYELGPEQFCPEANRIDFSAIGKSYDLFAQPWRPCQP